MNVVRLYVMYGLTFFVVSGALFSCSQQNESGKIDIIWKDKKAIAIRFPLDLAGDIEVDSVPHLIKIQLLTNAQPTADGILGEYNFADKVVTFTPLIAFTRGLHYALWARGQHIGDFVIPESDAADAPKLLAIFPSQDTLPENLLKIYLHFSRPMREGLSDQYVALVKNGSDTIAGAFLNLQPELWNADRTTLTLWLDPGRTKRDLIPNQKLGAPLQKNGHYQIVVFPKWRDQQGLSLTQSYIKEFVTTTRDSLSPDPNRWQILVPTLGSKNTLQINFGEPLDFGLLNETLKVKHNKGLVVAGKWAIGSEEKTASFTPADSWKSGKYTLEIETKLEDLSGNNINRPFDLDITRKTAARSGELVTLEFTVK